MRTALVTGSSGFLGRWLVELLRRQGVEVHALTRRDCDLSDARAVRERLRGLEPDVAFHLAASMSRTARDPSDLAPVNVRGTSHVLRSLPRATRVIHTGTLFEYGAQPAPFHEEQERAPRTAYGLTKLAAGRLVTRRQGTHVLLSLVYGPGQSEDFLVPQLLRARSTGEALAMTEGAQRRDFLWVEDAVEGLVRIAEAPDLAGRVVNLCTGVPTSLRDLVHRMSAPARLGALPYRPDEIFECYGSNALLRAATGWRPPTPLEEGLRRLGV